MEAAFNGKIFRKSSDWYVCLMLTLTVLQSKVIAPPIDRYEALAFLQKFGYMKEDDNVMTPVMSMRSPKNAILDYQKYMGINETGQLDDATLTMMSKPRCGMKDKLDDLTRRKRFIMEGSKWSSNIVYYNITKYPKRIKDQEMVDREIARAFKVWRYETTVRFSHRKKYGKADIDIRFEKRYHGHENSFDGPGNIYGHASPPKRNAFIHFDDEEEWTIDEHSGINLYQVAVHEIGHSLGLIHSDIHSAVMFPMYNENGGPAITLSKDDIKGIRTIYGDVRNSSICAEDSEFYTIDAATTTEDGKTYMFRGKYYWELVRGNDTIARPANETFPRKISDDWVGLPVEDRIHTFDRGNVYFTPSQLRGHLDAALTWPNGQTFFFMRDKFWSFRNKVMDPGYPKLISEGFKGIPMNIDAAFMLDNRTFFSKGSNLWEYDSQKTPPTSFVNPRGRGGLEDYGYMDAAMQFSDQRTYFFRGNLFTRLSSNKLTDSQLIRDDVINRQWFGCEYFIPPFGGRG